MKAMLYVIDLNKKTKLFIYLKVKIETFYFSERDGPLTVTNMALLINRF